MADQALLDTHALIWFSVAPEALSEQIPIITADEAFARFPGVTVLW